MNAPQTTEASEKTAAPATLTELMAQALAIEIEAAQRYAELADVMETHNNREVADLFRRMATIESRHADAIRAVRDVGRQAEQDQDRQRQQRAAAGQRVDEAREEARDRHGGEQQRVLIHASAKLAATVTHSSHNVARHATPG